MTCPGPHTWERQDLNPGQIWAVPKTVPGKQMAMPFKISDRNLSGAYSHVRHNPALLVTQMVLATH